MEVELRATTIGTPSGAGGTADSEFVVYGQLWDVQIDYDPSAPSSTVVALSESGGQARTFLSLSASKTDARYRPREVAHTSAGVAQAAYTEPFLIQGRRLRLVVTNCDPLTDAVVARINIKEK